jgi:hypothetical protein
VLEYARAVNAAGIEIEGFRGAALLSNGETLVEETAIGKRRAEQVAMLLQGANLTSPAYRVKWHEEPAAVTGHDDYRTRRVVVTVRPR